MSFELSALIRSVLDESDAADPHQLSSEVLARIAPEHYEAALGQALQHMVRVYVVRQRGAASVRRRPNSSRKVTAIRSEWQRLLHERHGVGDGRWKFLGDCTADELDYAAALRDEMAVRNAVKANELRKLAQLVRDYQVKTLRDVPPDAWGEEAAS